MPWKGSLFLTRSLYRRRAAHGKILCQTVPNGGGEPMQANQGKKWNELRARLFKMVSVGVVDDPINQGYDIISTLMLLVNLVGAFANTFDGVRAQYAPLLDLTEEITVAFFALDYALRLVTAKCLYPQLTEGRALAKYMLSAGGIVDLLSFLPFYLPVFFPSGAAAKTEPQSPFTNVSSVNS